jgi:hypothetical protein
MVKSSRGKPFHFDIAFVQMVWFADQIKQWLRSMVDPIHLDESAPPQTIFSDSITIAMELVNSLFLAQSLSC